MTKTEITEADLLKIKDHTSTSEKRDIARKHNLSKDTVLAVIRKDRNITDLSRPMFDELLKVAKKNFRKMRKDVLQAK